MPSVEEEDRKQRLLKWPAEESVSSTTSDQKRLTISSLRRPGQKQEVDAFGVPPCASMSFLYRGGRVFNRFPGFPEAIERGEARTSPT